MHNKLSKIWLSLISNFRKNPINFNFKQAVLKCIDNQRPSSYTHSMHPYPAKMFVYIPVFFLSIQEICPPNGVVLDPFCGSGTVLLECLINPYFKRRAYGVEMNPLGRLISKVKTTPFDSDELQNAAIELSRHLQKNSEEPDLVKFKNIDFWFSTKAIQRLNKLKFAIENYIEKDLKDFFWVCFSSIIRKVSRADPFIPPPVRLSIQKYRSSKQKKELVKKFLEHAENPDVIGLFMAKVQKNIEKIKELSAIDEIREKKVEAVVIWDDAQNIKRGRVEEKGVLFKAKCRKFPSRSVDLILTSPPYLTAQKYIRTQRLELLWLGFSENELIQLNKKMIGSEEVSIKEINLAEPVGVKSVDALVEWALSKSVRRGAMLLRYFTGMKRSLAEMHRVLKEEGRAIIVIGNNKVLGRHVNTYKLILDMAIDLGFKLEVILKDKIRGRGMITKRHNTGGLIQDEYIIVLKKEHS